MKTVAVLVGSLRRDSINRKYAEVLGKLASDRLRFQFVDLSSLPLYNDDLLGNPSAAVLTMKETVERADAVLFVTPEYNRHFSSVLHNAIDWGTRPRGKNSWFNKPAAITGTTPGATGTAAGQAALRGLVTVVGMVLMGQPEAYLTYKPELFDAEVGVTNADTKNVLQGFVDSFAAWIERVGG